jgi:hypothetical protein
MAEDKKEPIEVSLTELERAKLEAKELRATMVKQQLAAQVEKKYAAVIALETKQHLDTHPGVRLAERAVAAVTNEVLSSLQDRLPEGYAVDVLRWENGKAYASFDPSRAKQKVAAPEDAPVPAAAPEIAEEEQALPATMEAEATPEAEAEAQPN